MYVLLHGAKRNVGDFLIFERSRDLVRHHHPKAEFVELQRWHPLEQQLAILNSSEAIILCGGPCYSHHFYPNVVPLVSDLSTIKVPIIPLGIGWGVGNRVNALDDFHFTQASLAALKDIHERIPYSSVRDIVTEQVLKIAGIDNVVTTGCPVWYYLPWIERNFTPPPALKRIVISTPAKQQFFKQAGQLLLLVNRLFPKAEKYLVFHRGIWFGAYANKKEVLLNTVLAGIGKIIGYRIVDAAYSTQKVEFYKECDLHIGYRVHAHLDFLSYRKPSVLLQEDARGNGQSQTLQTQDLSATDPTAVQQLETLLNTHLQNDFSAFVPVVQRMQDSYRVMTEFQRTF